jgi:predicted permease
MTVLGELRHSARMLLRYRATTLLAVACLALGTGVVATMFASADPWLFRPMPCAAPERLVVVREVSPRGGTTLVSSPLFSDLREERAVFESVGAIVRTAYNLSTEEEPERVHAAAVSASLSPLLGVEPIAGRAFTDAEDRPSAARVCVIGFDLARRRFGSERVAVGRTLRLDGDLHTVVGVMPPQWKFPEYAEVWTPLRLPPGDRDRTKRRLDVIARLRQDVDVRAASDRVTMRARTAAALDRELSGGWSAVAQSLAESHTPPGVRAALHLMLAAALVVLLIAAANVTNLLLALAIERRREMATRLALGATRLRLVGQVLVESLILAGTGTVVGLALATWATDAMRAGFGMPPPFWADMSLTWRVALVTAAAGALAAVAASVLPAIASFGDDVRGALQENGRTVSAGVRTRRLTSIVAASELALAVVLMTGALLLVRSYANRQALDPGFQAANALTTRISLSGERYREPVDRLAFVRAITGEIAAQPGIEAVAAVRSLPFSDPVGGGWAASPIDIEGHETAPSRRPYAVVNAGTAAILDALGIPLVAGRALLEAEVENGAPVALVSRRTADRFWTGDAVGRRLRLADGPWLTIVGITGDVREPSSMLGAGTKPEWQVYVPYTFEVPAEAMLVVRGPAAEGSADLLRRTIRARDPQVPLYDVSTLRAARHRADWIARLWGHLLAVSALAGVVLACAGVYGVIARAVARRRQELSIRMALGAAAPEVIGLVMADGVRLALGGVAVGVLGALAFTRVLSSLLFGLSAWNPAAFAASALSLFALALVATYIPARRATRIDPSQALRAE